VSEGSSRRTYFHKAHALLPAGFRVSPGNWGRLIQGIGPQHNRFYAEFALEKIRQLEFSNKPSRMTSSFCWEDSQFAATYQRGGSPEHLYEVRLAEPRSNRHRGDMSWIDLLPGCRSFEAIEEVVRRYWRGEERDPRAWEIVVDGPLEVVSRLSPIADDAL
jgi:hypothetical protein